MKDGMSRLRRAGRARRCDAMHIEWENKLAFFLSPFLPLRHHHFLLRHLVLHKLPEMEGGYYTPRALLAYILSTVVSNPALLLLVGVGIGMGEDLDTSPLSFPLELPISVLAHG